ncbi:MAG: cell filamentation protein Fic [Gammaproteobacteria bacterium]|nr:MAG: cell filamentation protein Fic [Gammaproteobacteria bacterium]
MDNLLKEYISGQHEQQYQYKSFTPNPINEEWTFYEPEIITLMEGANQKLGELNAYSQLISDVDFFIRMHIVKEATTSSRIEGTQTNMEEALIDEKDINPESRDDWLEVQNYIEAIKFSIEKLNTLPLSNRILKETHNVLMKGARGKHKQPGIIRTSQNWIGVSLKNATFIPPHHDRLPDLMTDFEKYIHNDEIHVPHLIKIAILHYQFETIHPFLDGNGRLGRLFIVLYLVNFNLLAKPALYLSDFFERNKAEYYNRLMAVRTNNDMVGWLRFFLYGLRESAENSIHVFKQIMALKEEIERKKLPTLNTRKQDNAQNLIMHLYKAPVVSIKNIRNVLNVQTNTASSLVKDFTQLGILKELTGRKRNRLFIFEEYFQIFVNK